MNKNKKLSASEAVWLLLGWLTSREEVTTLSRTCDIGHAYRLGKEFCEKYNVDKPWTEESWIKKMHGEQ